MQADLWEVLQGLFAVFALAVEVLAVSQSRWWEKTERAIQDAQNYVDEAITLSRRRTGRLTVVSIHADRLRALREQPMKRHLAEVLAKSNNMSRGINALYYHLHMVFGWIIISAILITLYLVVSFYLGISQDLQTTGGWCWLQLVARLISLPAPSFLIFLILVFRQSTWVGREWIPLSLLVGVGVARFVCDYFMGLSLWDFVLWWFLLIHFYIGVIVWRLWCLKMDADRMRDKTALILRTVPGTFS